MEKHYDHKNWRQVIRTSQILTNDCQILVLPQLSDYYCTLVSKRQYMLMILLKQLVHLTLVHPVVQIMHILLHVRELLLLQNSHEANKCTLIILVQKFWVMARCHDAHHFKGRVTFIILMSRRPITNFIESLLQFGH